MRILQLISSNGFFGAENMMMELTKRLQTSKYKTYIGIIGNNQFKIKEIVEKNNLESIVFNCNGKFNIKTILRIRDYIKCYKIDIIHSHGYKSNFYSFLANFGLDTNKIVTCHNWLGDCLKMKFYECLDKLIIIKFDKVIVVSENIKRDVLKSIINSDKVVVINNGININRFKNTNRNLHLKKILGVSDNEQIVATVGRLIPEKGYSYLIKSFKSIIRVFPKTKLLIIGDGPLRSKLVELVKRLGLEHRVIFIGIRNDIPELLNLIDIFVMPSLKEGMPMALLEAMAARKTIVASSVGAIPKVIQNGKTGLLVNPKDISGISDSIISLLQDRKKSAFLAKNAYKRAQNEFSVTKMAEEYIKVYSELLRNNQCNLNHRKQSIIQLEIAGKGGISHYTYNLAQELSRYRKVKLLTGQDYELKEKDRIFDLIGLFNRFKTNPLLIFKFIKIINDKKVCIVHFQLSQYPAFILILCSMVKLFSNKKIIITAHNVVSHEQKFWERHVYKIIYKLSDKLIVHANANKLELKRSFSVNSNKVNVIPHGNYMFFTNEIITPHKETHNILFFGYIRKYKGLMYLLRALAKVKRIIPDVKLYIVGKPIEDFGIYQEEINKLGLNNNVNINLEYVQFSRVKEYFNNANVVVLPYLNIYQSGVVQLAYGFGRPVVVTNVGGLPEAVEDGHSGFVVPAYDTKTLADRIVTILSVHGLQQRMGKYALDLAKNKFSWDFIVKKTVQLYDNILN